MRRRLSVHVREIATEREPRPYKLEVVRRPNAMVSAAVSAKTGLFRRVRPANCSRNGILPDHSRAAVAQRIPLRPLFLSSLLQTSWQDPVLPSLLGDQDL